MLHNVIAFTVGGRHYALELRWVREVVRLSFVTTVPTAPAAVGGVCNLHGAILPVLDLGALLHDAPGAPPRQGDGALVIEVEGTTCALRVDQVDRVASLYEVDGALRDAAGRPLALVDPLQLMRRATEHVEAERLG